MELNRIYQGDWIEVMKSWPNEFIQCVITSPPYWGLRDYGVDGQLGLEETPEEYIEKMVAGFREVRRVLRKDGTVWLNLGDSYASNTKGTGGGWADHRNSYACRAQRYGPHRVDHGLKTKDLCMIPARVALALQTDGWYLRSDIIWDKPNPMPESVRDRPTKSHEYIFLLTKSARYYYDAEAVREPQKKSTLDRLKYRLGNFAKQKISDKTKVNYVNPNTESATRDRALSGVGRNLRSVWTIPTQPCSFAHFATFPEKLVNRCILAGTSEMACGICGKPYKRVVEASGGSIGKSWRDHKDDQKRGNRAANKAKGGHGYKRETLGFWPDCEHDYFPIMDSTGKCIVLDPLCGTNTVGYRAQEMGRQWLGIELNDKYIAYGVNRAAQEVIL